MRRGKAAAFVLAWTTASIIVAGSRAEPGDVTHLSNLLPPGAGVITDVWGYVDPATNREYAAVGDRYRGFYLIDVTDPTTPFVALDYTGFEVPGFDVKVWNTFVYVCDGSFNTLTSHVIDVANLASPVKSSAFPAAHNFAVDPAGYLYAERLGLRCYDLRDNPMSPKEIWSNETWADGHDATIVGDRLYDFRAGLYCRIWDVSNRAAPSLLSTIQHPSIAYYHSGAPTEDGRYVYLCDESPSVENADITVWDVSNYGAPRLVTSIWDSTSTVHNLYIVGDLAFAAYYAAGFKVFDVSNPEDPTLVGHYPTSALSGEGFKGAFGVYPFTPSGNVYVSDMQNGLFVFAVEGVTTPITIQSFAARPRKEGVELSWRIASDEPVAGFRIHRDDRSADDVPISGLLPPQTRSFLDANVTFGERYSYRVVALSEDGSLTRSQTVDVTIAALAAVLGQNRPNPMSVETTIPFNLTQAGPVRLTIVDARGRRLRTLIDGFRPAGPGEAMWNGRNDAGQAVPSGIYFYRLFAGGKTFTKRIALVR